MIIKMLLIYKKKMLQKPDSFWLGPITQQIISLTNKIHKKVKWTGAHIYTICTNFNTVTIVTLIMR